MRKNNARARLEQTCHAVVTGTAITCVKPSHLAEVISAALDPLETDTQFGEAALVIWLAMIRDGKRTRELNHAFAALAIVASSICARVTRRRQRRPTQYLLESYAVDYVKAVSELLDVARKRGPQPRAQAESQARYFATSMAAHATVIHDRVLSDGFDGYRSPNATFRGFLKHLASGLSRQPHTATNHAQPAEYRVNLTPVEAQIREADPGDLAALHDDIRSISSMRATQDGVALIYRELQAVTPIQGVTVPWLDKVLRRLDPSFSKKLMALARPDGRLREGQLGKFRKAVPEPLLDSLFAIRFGITIDSLAANVIAARPGNNEFRYRRSAYKAERRNVQQMWRKQLEASLAA